jgi:threonine dehydrogenase-like Zn-dependent dehydrogenase
MKAILFDGRKVRFSRDAPRPEPPVGEALIRIRKAGICATDLEIAKGYMGFKGIMGHEFVGTVEKGPDSWKGKRVVGEINCACGTCQTCTSGLSNHCPNRTVLGIENRDGVFADCAILPVRNLHRVPEGVSDDDAVFAEPLAAAYQIARQVPLEPDQDVLVIGDGRLAQLIVRMLVAQGCRPRMVGKHANRMQAAEKIGVQTTHVQEYKPRPQIPLVIEAGGSPAGLDLAMRCVRPRGTILLKSTTALGEELNLAPLVVNEITVVGSRCGPFADALEALETGAVDVSALITAEYPLERGLEAFQAARDPRNLKVLIRVS